MFQELAQMLGIKKTRITPFHPQFNGQVERHHRTLLDYLAKFISENQKDWDRWVSLGLLAYRSSKHEATDFTPSELFLGRGIRLPLDLLRGCPPDFELVRKKNLSGQQELTITQGKNRPETTRSRQDQNSTSKCFKCRKTGHYGRDCRTSKYALSKPERPSRINAINKFCKHCKKNRAQPRRD